MAASLSWVDFAPSDRERMQRTLALFDENDTRDELGLGTIRDAISDALFPGTSTIQTRLKYFLFVPWHYAQEGHKSGDKLRRGVERSEKSLIQALKDESDEVGVIGRRTGDALKRLPSQVYWAGLNRWGILRANVSHEEYATFADDFQRRKSLEPPPDDEGVAPESQSIWHPRIPEPPAQFPKSASLKLSRQEAEFIQGRITTACSETLLGWLANHFEPVIDVEAPWRLNAFDAAYPKSIQETLLLAQQFSFAMYGAALLYNFMLARECDDEALRAQYREALESWESDEERRVLDAFETKVLWVFMDREGARVSTLTQQFVERWISIVQRNQNGIAENPDAKALVRHQEKRLKKGRSRFTNRRALDQWGGASATSRLTYRWGRVRVLLNDLYGGLDWVKETLPNEAARESTRASS